jgi:hypothetical protein
MNEPDWLTLIYSPFWVFVAVAGADGKMDAKEVDALHAVLEGAEAGGSQLLSDVLAACAEDPEAAFDAFRTDGRTVDDGLAQVRQVLDRELGEDRALDFKRGLLSLGVHFAQASGGGMLGFGSKVSPEERSSLALLVGFLGLPAEELPSSF